MNERNHLINQFIKNNYGKQSNEELQRMIEREFGELIQLPTLRQRYKRMKDKPSKPKKESENIIDNKTKIFIENDNAELNAEQGTIQTAYNKLKKAMEDMGYNLEDYNITPIKFSEWEQQSKTGVIDLQSVRFKIEKKPTQNLDLEICVEEIKKVMKSVIEPLKLNETPKNKNLINKKVMYAPAFELHLGKLAYTIDVGQDYNSQIAEERFFNIIEEIIEKQLNEKCEKLVLPIGNDFFNYDTNDYTTTRGTYQHSDLSPRAMFLKGNEMYIKAIKTLEPHFNEIELQLQGGNHEEKTIFNLYIALMNFFANSKKVKFKDDFKEFQATMLGNTVIFSSHGNSQEIRTAMSWATEFPKEWAKAIYREWHKGHLHHTENKKMKMSDKENHGLIIRTSKSPAGLDDFHYKNRWVGADAGYQFYVYDLESGLSATYHLNFDKKKVLIKK